MAAEEDEAAEALVMQPVEHVPNQGDVRGEPEADGAGERGEGRSEAERQHRQHRDRLGLRSLEGPELAEDRVYSDGKVRVLLRRSQGNDDAVIVREVLLDLFPRHVPHSHGIALLSLTGREALAKNPVLTSDAECGSLRQAQRDTGGSPISMKPSCGKWTAQRLIHLCPCSRSHAPGTWFSL